MARIVGLRRGLFALGELLLPTVGAIGFCRGRALVPAYSACCTLTGFFRAGRAAQLRAMPGAHARRLGGRSAEAPQDLEALRSRADLMDEVHDAQ